MSPWPLLGGWTLVVLAKALEAPVHLEDAWRYLAPPTLAGWWWGGGLDALGRHARAAAGTGVLALALAGAGGAAGRWIAAGGDGGSRAHVRWLAGLAAGSMLVLGLGFTGLLRAPLLWGLLGCGVAAAAPGLVRSARAWRPRRRAREPLTPLAALCLALAGTGVVIALLAALAPQVWYDALQYYYVAPRRALAHGWYLSEAGVPSDGYPHGFELLYVPAFLIGGEPIAMLLTALELFLTAAALNGLLRDAGAGREARALASALFWTLPFTGQLPHLSYSDAAVMHGAAVGLWLLRRGEAGAAALAAGWLLSLKYTAVIPVVPLWAAALRRRPSAWRPAAAAALVCAGPWAARNLGGHGQAFYPLFASLGEAFDTPVTMPAVFDLQSAVPSGGLAGRLAALLGAGWRAHIGGDVSGFASFGALWLLPMAVMLGGAELVVLVGGALAGWLLLGQATLRYFEPAVAWTFAGAIAGLDRRRLTRAAAVPALAFCGLGLLDGMAQGYRWVNPVAVVAGAERPQVYLRRILTPAPHYMTLAAESGERFRGGTTYVLGDAKAYYWKGEFLVDTVGVKPWLARWIETADSPERLRVAFRQRDVRHLAYFVQGMPTYHHYGPRAYVWTRARLARYQAFWERTMACTGELISPRDGVAYYLFDLAPRAPRPWPPTRFPFTLPGTEPLTWPGDVAWLAGDRGAARRWYARAGHRFPAFVVGRWRRDALGSGP